MSVVITKETIGKAVYDLCEQANVVFSSKLYEKIYELYEQASDVHKKLKYSNILENIKSSYHSQRPLCQDTGQVVVFLEIGVGVLLDCNPEKVINDAVAKAYTEKFYRKSVVRNTLFDRENTGDNTPVIIYTEFIDSSQVNIKLMVKGAGSENYGGIKMFTPAAEKEEIFEFVKTLLEKAGEKACPPYVLGIGCGGTMDKAAVLSKKAFFAQMSNEEKAFADALRQYLKGYGIDENVLDVNVLTSGTHIACLPVALTINCHSTRHAQCSIENNVIKYETAPLAFKPLIIDNTELREVFSNDIEALRDLKNGENILLSGEIYTARDAAHVKIFDLHNNGQELPFDLKDKIIFYAGPCPAAPDETIGPIGPTTSSRMDKYTELVYGSGVVATIGKGERSVETIETIKKYNGKYLIVQGGIACLLSKCVLKAETIAFDELGTEAVRKLVVKKLPVQVCV